MKIIESVGEVTFYEDSKGNLHQQIGNSEIFKVKDGSMGYKKIKSVKGYDIKYNTNGVHGFSVWKGNNCLEDGFWVLNDVEDAAHEM